MPFSDFEVISEHLLELEMTVESYIRLPDALLPSVDELLPKLGSETTSHCDVSSA